MKKLALFGDMDINCYVIEYKNKCYIVDPGFEKDKIVKYVQDNNLEVLGILLTHGHTDHISAIHCFKVPVYIHKKEYDLFLSSYNNVLENYKREMDYKLEEIDIKTIDESKVFPFEDKEISVIYTPGHTFGGVCYKFEDDLFTGDTLFKGVVGKWTFKTGNLEEMQNSIISLIDSQNENVRIHPGHGESSTIGDEKRGNKFYLKWK